jgi:signal transduction histidine kinase
MIRTFLYGLMYILSGVNAAVPLISAQNGNMVSGLFSTTVTRSFFPGNISETFTAQTDNDLDAGQASRSENDIEHEILLRVNHLKEFINYLSILILVVCVVATFLIIRSYRMRRKLDLLLEEKNNQLAAQNLHLEKLNREKNDLLSVAIHDLNSPLNSILLSSKLLARDIEDIGQINLGRMINIIGNTAQRMKGILSNLMDLSIIESGSLRLDMKPLQVDYLIENLIHEYNSQAEAKSINIIYDLLPKELEICGDEKATFQVLDNLLSNAVKYSRPGSRIWLFVREADHKVQFEIKDEGPGLTEEDKKKLFSKFSRLSARPTAGENSTGLGLSIAKKFMESMQGRIWCESTPGEGASFIVEFSKPEF